MRVIRAALALPGVDPSRPLDVTSEARSHGSDLAEPWFAQSADLRRATYDRSDLEVTIHARALVKVMTLNDHDGDSVQLEAARAPTGGTCRDARTRARHRRRRRVMNRALPDGQT